MSADDLDLVNRDPNNLNDHVRVCLDEVIGEPDGAHSINCVWVNSYRCFECWKSCCYNMLTVLCAIPISICWGCEFAYITFLHVWYYTPYLRAHMIQCGCLQKFYGACLQCCLQPCFEAFGFCFNNIKVTE